jgi:glycosyltransferase involved in cell wall biosynthesis
VNILWISQTILAGVGGGTIGQTDRVEMPRQVALLGHRVWVVVGAPPGEMLRGSRPVPHDDAIYLPMINRPFLTTLTFQVGLFVVLPFLLLAARPDVIIVDHFSVLAILPWALLGRLGILRPAFILDLRTLPVDVAGWRGWITSRRFDLSVAFAARFMAGLTMITPRMREMLARRLGIPESRIGVWESGVNLEQFSAGRSRRHELSWTGEFIVLYHGSLSPNRGLQMAVAAFTLLRERCPAARLCLLGSGAAEDELRALITQLGLGDRVRLYPPVPYAEVNDYVASADIGIIPLPNIEWWSTSSPLKLLEYLAAGKPVIVSRIAGHVAVVGDCACAWYLPEVLPEAIADGVAHFYARQGALGDLGSLGQALVAQRYTWATQARKLVAYLVAVRGVLPAGQP